MALCHVDDGWIIDVLFERGQIDDVDRVILEELTSDSRLSTQAISEKVRISRTATHERIKKLTQRGILLGFTSRLNPYAAGLATRAFILVKFDASMAGKDFRQKDAAKALSRIKYVRRVFIITGQFEFIVEVQMDTMHTLADIIMDNMKEIPGISQTQTMNVFDEYVAGVRQPRANE